MIAAKSPTTVINEQGLSSVPEPRIRTRRTCRQRSSRILGRLSRHFDSRPTCGYRPLDAIQLWMIAAAAAALFVPLLGIVLYITTNHGTVKIELSDPKANAVVKVDGETDHGGGTGRTAAG